jgi:hypothetical protein
MTLSLDKLAAACGISRRHLHALIERGLWRPDRVNKPLPFAHLGCIAGMEIPGASTKTTI